MANRPILFSAPMIRRIIAGEKTQTRRIMPNNDAILRHAEAFNLIIIGGQIFNYAGDEVISEARIKVGDTLWVRESCRAIERESDGRDMVEYLADNAALGISHEPECGIKWLDLFHYGQRKGERPKGLRGRSVPSIHMPKWASRITLKVTDVRVQRLQDCSEADALAEGIHWENVITGCNGHGGVHHEETADRYFTLTSADDDTEDGQGWEEAADAYMALWDHINGPGAADKNPWVVAYTFTAETRTEEAQAQ